MANTHGIPDLLKEIQSIDGDLLPAAIVSATWPTTPGSGLTIPAFATQGYCRSGPDLIYVDQPARPVTVSSTAGSHWLALARDTHSAVAGWTRTPGSHYLEQANATQPATPDGAVIFAQATVSAGNVTAVTPLPVIASRAASWRTHLELGSMSQQNANAVAITGGTVAGVTRVLVGTSTDLGPTWLLQVEGGVRATGRLDLNGTAQLNTTLAVGAALLPIARTSLVYPKTTDNGLVIQPSQSDSGGAAVEFRNLAGTVIGSIATTATATAYNTSSDVRLKHAIATLAGALDAVRALRPVAFRWNADDSADEGFLAHELQQVLPRAVTGEPDAVNEDGSVKPMQVDHSKLVPILVAAVKELLARVEVLEQALA